MSEKQPFLLQTFLVQLKNVASISKGRHFISLFIILSNLEQLLALPVAKQQNAIFKCFFVEMGTNFLFSQRWRRSLFAQGILILFVSASSYQHSAKVSGKHRHLYHWTAVCKILCSHRQLESLQCSTVDAQSLPLCCCKDSTRRKRYFCVFLTSSWECG